MNSPVRQILVSTLIVFIVVLLAGATYQGVTTALERRQYPHPGQLADVGGHQLHVNCTGEGAPTVILEAPAAGMSALWGWVQPRIAEAARVCSYDRAGLGWSEAGDKPYDPGRVPEELHALLEAIGEPGPYVLAGHSLGASFVRRFASLYPADTAAVVLIDPPDVEATVTPTFFVAAPWLARAGVLRATGTLSRTADDLPEPARGAARSFLNRPDHLTRAAREMARWNDTVRLGADAHIPASVPVVTLQSEGARTQARTNSPAGTTMLDQANASRISDAIVRVVETLRHK